MTITWSLSYTLVSLVTSSIVLLIYRHVTYDMGSRKEIDAFRLFLVSFVMFILCNGVCIWANYFSIGMLGTVFTTISLIALCATAYFWFYYIELRLSPHRLENKTYSILMTIPMLVVMLMIASSQLTHFIFYYDHTGSYCRGPLYFIILLAASLYLVTASVHTYQCMEFAKTSSQKKQYYYLIIFILFPFIAGIIDFLFAHLPSMELVVLFGIVLIYLNLQHSQIYRDALTGLNNRRLTDEYLVERIAFVDEDKPLYCLMADVDMFKEINDKFGHLEGDRALQLVAEVLKKYTDIDHYYISRWGGDEFVIIVDRGSDFDPDEFKRRFVTDVEKEQKRHNLPYDIAISLGCSKCEDPSMGVEEIIRLADKRMYDDKHKDKTKIQDMV